MSKKIGCFLGAAALALALLGCNPDAGKPGYEIVFPSGTVISGKIWFDQLQPVENSTLKLYTEHLSGSNYQIHLLDEEEEDLFAWDVSNAAHRGQVVDGELWVCGELWASIHNSGYMDSDLKSGKIYRFDVESGATTFEGDTGEGELFLSVRDNRFYFYDRGSAKVGRNAEIFYRRADDWDEKVSVCKFDYAERPKEADFHQRGSGAFTVRFALEEDAITVSWYCKESDGEDEMKDEAVVWSKEIHY